MVPVVGLEPTRPCGQQILSLSRLPIPTHRRADPLYYITSKGHCQAFFANLYQVAGFFEKKAGSARSQSSMSVSRIAILHSPMA